MNRLSKARLFLLLFLPVMPLALGGCMSAYKQSVGGDVAQVFTRIYLTDFNTAWQGVLESIKSLRLDITNREGGFIQTRWTENTSEKNFIESFGGADSYLKAQYRLKLSIAKGFYNGRPSVKVSVQKEQMIQNDVLEGWRPVETDGVEEKTLLYRIGRIVSVRLRLSEIEKRKAEELMAPVSEPAESSTPAAPGGSDPDLDFLDQESGTPVPEGGT